MVFCEKFSNSKIFCSLPDAHATVSTVENSVLDAVGNFGVCSGKAQCVLCFAECRCILTNLVKTCCVVFITVGAYWVFIFDYCRTCMSEFLSQFRISEFCEHVILAAFVTRVGVVLSISGCELWLDKFYWTACTWHLYALSFIFLNP